MPTDVKKFHGFNNILLGNVCRNACIFSVPWLWAVGNTFLRKKRELFFHAESFSKDLSNDDCFYQLRHMLQCLGEDNLVKMDKWKAYRKMRRFWAQYMRTSWHLLLLSSKYCARPQTTECQSPEWNEVVICLTLIFFQEQKWKTCQVPSPHTPLISLCLDSQTWAIKKTWAQLWIPMKQGKGATLYECTRWSAKSNGGRRKDDNPHSLASPILVRCHDRILTVLSSAKADLYEIAAAVWIKNV